MATAIKISLLHATWHRERGPAEVIEAWLSTANDPGAVEYVLAHDDDDDISACCDIGRPLVTVSNPPDPTWSTAVRNWNAAAARSSGDLLFVIADDLYPPNSWDSKVIELVCGLDPREVAFAVKTNDHPNDDIGMHPLMRHPLVSRKFYQDLGLFDPRFYGMYCDRDITQRAQWKSAILDGTGLRLIHDHPTSGQKVNSSVSRSRGNRPSEYDHGQEVFETMWPKWRRCDVVLIDPKKVKGSRLRLRLWALLSRAQAFFDLVLGSFKRRIVRTKIRPTRENVE